MAKIIISACLIVHNEEHLLTRCLESLDGVVDEIILIHDGPCSDRTLEIAERFGARIFVREFVGNAEPHRPFSFKQAVGDWILQIDADEYLSEELRQNIRKLSENEAVSAYEFVWPLWNGKKYRGIVWPLKRCFFRRDRLSFLGVPHFVAEVDGRVEKSRLVLYHEPEYDNYRWRSFRNKWLPWAKIQAAYYLKNFSEIEKFNYHQADWSMKIIIRKKFPLLLLPLDFVLVFSKTLFSGAYHLGLFGLKAALMPAFYRAMIDYYLFRFKIKK